MTYDEASKACNHRGGHLAHVKSFKDLDDLIALSDGQDLGVGLRVIGADEWHFDAMPLKDGSNATAAIDKLKTEYGNEINQTGCMKLSSRRRNNGGKKLRVVDCEVKSDWICEGTEKNTETPGIEVKNDLKADEGAFCLWDLKEPVDSLPNDEGTNFKNTDLACSLQVSSRNRYQCAYNVTQNKLLTERGNRTNAANYPVRGADVGWSGTAAKETFLALEDANDYFHCHYTPSNSGLLRMFAFQHMYERNYPGALKRKCGCGYKHLSKLVSRCDCTRSGKADNNCAQWHGSQLARATKDQPVKCNNCNAKHNL